ncbi:ASCH domain-containing protein [Magnetospirillum molischianum]|uniref:Uncharacterized protein n=1 Tax=Magnetospirillum molischianum DSM 120 TaxID=1150626 RepID=H8FYA2_MAGML|nr:ASCH domain-containing protein [Magnetospirillum molischianum]CCG43340.1 conserved hypothetical protein [Magnetospirillum molischianum DSM 120]
MKALSVWQPWALLLVTGHKRIETRPWPAPNGLIGQEVAIASCKNLRTEQRVAYAAPDFQVHYAATGLPPLAELPRGAVIGKTKLLDCKLMTDELIARIPDRERAFGIYAPGRFAWFMGEPIRFNNPVPASGRLGLWDWDHEQVRAFEGKSVQI